MDFMITCVPSYLIKKKKDIDEASDTYDTIDWLVKIRQIMLWGVGISYPGFYSTYSLLSNHPFESSFATSVY
jgi:predicted acyl esterase